MPDRKRRILVVDDQSELRVIFEWALKKGAYDVTTVSSARQAMRLIDNEHFDLILTDLAMPGISGIELIEHVRAHEEKSRTPIVAVTAHSWDQIALQACAAGCDGVIQKPVEPKTLRAEVEKYLRGWRFADGQYA